MRALGALPLTLRLPLMAAALMVVVGAVASRQVLSALSAVQDARVRELARQHVEGLSVALGPLVLRRDVWEVFDTLDRASDASAGRRMVMTAVADDSGRVLAATDPRRAPIDSPIAALAEGAQTLDAFRIDSGATHMRVTAPLSHQGRAVGRIVTELDVSDLAAERRRAALLLLMGNMAATVALAAGGYLAMRRMLRPVATLVRHMDADAPTPISPAETPRGDTEVARLFHTYNAMTGAMAARAEAERRLAERERFVSLGRLASSLAHEINNPLGGMLNATDTIRRYADRPDAVRGAADLLERGLKHLRDVARAALDHNRLDRAGAPFGRDDIEDLQLLIAPEVRRFGQTLEWDAVADDAALAAWPAAPLRQIALNLLLNAAAAAGEGGAVGLSLRADAAGLRLTVRDDGPGLSEAALGRLLTDEATQPGGGVGLRLVRDLTAELGGALTHRRAGGVTEIALSLPAGGIAPC